MKNEAARFAFAAICLVFGGAAEELLPRMFGVGPPVLMAASVWVARRSDPPFALSFAFAAGAMEDALSSQLPLSGAAFFVALALVSRLPSFPSAALFAAYPLHLAWTSLLSSGSGGGFFARALASVAAWAVAYAATGVAVACFGREVALDEP